MGTSHTHSSQLTALVSRVARSARQVCFWSFLLALLAQPWGLLTAPDTGLITTASAYADQADFRIGYIAEELVNLRANPSTLADVVAQVEHGRIFKALGKKDQWWHILFPTGTEGWLAGWVVETFPYSQAPINVKAKYDAAFKGVQIDPNKPRKADAEVGWIGYDTVNVRKEPTTEAELVCQVDQDTRVKPLLVQGDWIQVELPTGVKGWIYSNLIDFPGQKPLWINCDAANIRSKPDMEAEKVSLLPRDAKVYLVDQSGSWYQVSFGDGKQGWVFSELLTAEAPVDMALSADNYNDSDTPSSSAEKLANIALQYKGTSYRYGGMSSRGFDCSGLTAYCLSKLGIKAPHHSGQQYTSIGRKVAKSDLVKGDLVFFNTRGDRVSHVGVYLGDGKFVHAANPSRGVTVNSLNEGYYLRTYVGAKRVFE